MAKAKVTETKVVAKAKVTETKVDTEILGKVKICQDYLQWILMIDISNIVPFELFGELERIFPKVGLTIKRQFGFLGYYWGYGPVIYTTYPDRPATISSNISINIYFPSKIDDEWLITNIKKVNKIYNYIKNEYNMYFTPYEETDDDEE